MITLKTKIRKDLGKKTKKLRKKEILPAVLYGEGIRESFLLEVGEKDFEKAFKEAGESSLISLGVGEKKFEVLIHQLSKDPLTGRISHVEFFHPSSKKEVVAEVQLVFEGEAPAIKELGGNLLKEIQSVEVKGLARNLPKEIRVDLNRLKSFEDRVFVKDLVVPEGTNILKEKDEIVALVVPLRKEEEEKPEEPAMEAVPSEGNELKEGGEKKITDN